MNGQAQVKGNPTVGLDSPTTITGILFERVRDMILRAEIAPGERLLPRELSIRFGVSSTPIREALRLLEQANLVQIVPHKGAVVRPILSVRQAEEIYTVRLALELLALKLYQSSEPKQQWESLRRATENYARAHEADDFEAALTWDMRFHNALVAASGNAVLQDVFARLENQIQVLRRLDRGQTRREQALRDHRTILESLTQGDFPSATAALEEHILNGKESVLANLSKLEPA
jgi:DNA-binding GntR family transcriptional regulator